MNTAPTFMGSMEICNLQISIIMIWKEDIADFESAAMG